LFSTSIKDWKPEGKQCHFSFFSHVEFFRAGITSEFECTRFSVAVAEVPLDIVMRKVK